MTETTVVATAMNPAELSTDSSVGVLVAGLRARLVDPKTGKDVPVHPDSTGEVWVQGPNIMKGYWRNPTATAGTMSDGWLRTGDMARVDENGRWFIVDRLKELIKVKGFQVAPAELEGLLLENPKVADVGVVGVVIQGNECPRAYVALKPGMTATKKEISEFVEKHTTRYKWLTGGVVFVDEIPKNPVSFALENDRWGLHANDFIVGEDPEKGPARPCGEGLEAVVSLYGLVQCHHVLEGIFLFRISVGVYIYNIYCHISHISASHSYFWGFRISRETIYLNSKLLLM